MRRLRQCAVKLFFEFRNLVYKLYVRLSSAHNYLQLQVRYLHWLPTISIAFSRRLTMPQHCDSDQLYSNRSYQKEPNHSKTIWRACLQLWATLVPSCLELYRTIHKLAVTLATTNTNFATAYYYRLWMNDLLSTNVCWTIYLWYNGCM